MIPDLAQSSPLSFSGYNPFFGSRRWRGALGATRAHRAYLAGTAAVMGFEAALRRTCRIPPVAQPGYLMGIRLELYIAQRLRKVGCGGG
jgi:hypothetical protein